VLGLEFVSGTGSIARGGGRVVKNVAGFDLARLLCSSWGTLGVITEVTVRVHARPERDESFAIALDGSGAAGRVRQVLRRLPFAPYACEVVNEALAQHLLGKAEATAIIRLGGNSEALDAQQKAFSELGDARPIDGTVWDRLRTCEPASSNVFRLSQLPTEIDSLWALGRPLSSAFIHATPLRGIVRFIMPRSANEPIPTISPRIKRFGERLSPDLWPQFPGTTSTIASRIKKAFDPRNVLNPGILGDLA
jgi:glycolate oxidase FAD binding subunit